MTKSQEQRMNQLASEYADNDGHMLPYLDFKAGYQAAMKEAEVLVEALEQYAHELSTYEGIKPNRAMIALKKFKGE